MRPEPSTSLTLLQRAQDNDQLAWGQLVELYGPLVHRWCRNAGLQDDDAGDVFQETFRAVARNLARFAPRKTVGSFRSWLKSIARSKLTDHFRQQQQGAAGVGGSHGREQLANLPDPLTDESPEEASLENAVVVQRAMELIRGEFSTQNWSAFQRVAIDGQRAADVAADLGLNPAAVRQANYRIRRRLRLVLKDLVDD